MTTFTSAMILSRTGLTYREAKTPAMKNAAPLMKKPLNGIFLFPFGLFVLPLVVGVDHKADDCTDGVRFALVVEVTTDVSLERLTVVCYLVGDGVEDVEFIVTVRNVVGHVNIDDP